MLLVALGLGLASIAQNVWQVYLTYSLGVGVGLGMAYVPAVGAVQRWFVRRRGMASGLAVSGIGAGTLVIPLVAAGSIEWLGWRETYLLLAGLALLIGIPAALAIEQSPAARGVGTDGDAHIAPVAGASTVPAGNTLREALSGRPFWLLFGSGLSASLGIFIPFAHLAPYAVDEGFSDRFGAFLIGMIGIGSIVGRLVLGGGADRLGRRTALISTFIGMGVCLTWWLAATQAWSLIIFALAFGAAYGGFVALMPAVAADYFGGRSVGAILGVLYSSAAIGALFGPTIAGAIYDSRESYALPIILAIALNGVAVLCVAIIRPPRPFAAVDASPPADHSRPARDNA
jgi:MFS family permease